MVSVHNFQLSQGEDKIFEMVYKEGEEGSEVAVDLSTDYQARMDITAPNSSSRLYTLNSDNIVDVDPNTDGDQEDATIEITLSSGAAGSPNVSVKIPRAVSLPGGALYEYIDDKIVSFGYDLFLRHVPGDSQSKILTGHLLYRDSETLWA